VDAEKNNRHFVQDLEKAVINNQQRMIAISAKSCFRRNWPEVSIMSIFVHFDAVSPRCTAIKQCYGNQSEIVSGRKETPNVTS
jgi:hypothetical protein